MKAKGSNIASKGFIGLMVAQFLGAFNDNAFKLVVSLYVLGLGTTMKGDSKVVSIAGAFFIIPFVLFSTYAGWLSDKFSKNTVIVKTKVAEIIIMALGFFAIFSGNFFFMFLILFLMGTQSAFFSPSKYGILPEIVRVDELSRANGILQMFTFLAIILGTAGGGWLITIFRPEVYLSALVFVGIAMLGAAASLFVQKVRPAKESKLLELNPIKSAYFTFRRIKNDRSLLFTILAIAFFWFIGALFHLNILVYGKSMMKLAEGDIGNLLATIALGIGIGSFAAGRLSGGKIEFGLVPFGSIGMVLFCWDLSYSYGSFSRTARDLFLLGFSSGFFIVPLTAYLQQHSAATEKGENIAFCNLISFSGMLFASFYLYFMTNILDIDPAGVFSSMSVAVVIVSLFLFKGLSGIFARALMWGHVRLRHKVTVRGQNHIPKRGGALIVCNNTSYLDSLIIAFSVQRSIRFVVPEQYYKNPMIHVILRLIKAIPASKSGSKGFTKALYRARLELEKGHLVCVFPEGGATKTGGLRQFSAHLIRIARAKAPKAMESAASRSFPIIPVYIDTPPAGFYGLKRFLHARRRTVCFGRRLKSDSSAHEVRRAVSLSGTEAFYVRKSKRSNKLLHLSFIDMAKRRFFYQYISDSLGFNLSYGSALAAAMAFSKKLSGTLKKDEKMVGVMMPTSCIATLLNFAVMMAGRVPVNLNYTAPKSAINAATKKCKIKKIFTSEKLLKKMKIKKTDEMILVEEFFKDIDIIEKLKSYIKAFITPKFILKLKYKRGLKGDDLATVIFSSGSTGDPKGIMLSHSNVLSNIEGIAEMLPLTKDENFCCVLPFFHSFGFTATLMLPAVFGFKAVFHPNPLDSIAIGKIVQKNECTVLLGTPTFLAAYIRKCTKKNFKSLKLVVAGAEKVKKNVKEAFNKKFGVYPLEGFGCTELSPVVSVCRPDIDFEGATQKGMKEGSVGRPLPGVAVTIVDPETAKELAENEDGLLIVKGPNVMKGYLGEKEMTDKVLRKGWYNTNDIAHIDADGFITITDRLSRFSKIGGEMVPHLRVENAIHDVLGADILTCIVTSVPDGKKGERLVVLHTEFGISVDKLWDRLNETDLPKLWIPKKTSFLKVDEIPMLGTGKVSLRKVKAIAKENFTEE
jgi:acyl-[acyl-carrier-protein]-phospholipid O-acyltransferase/long-chain-fatty-acid--[acyl-carrier-protein] ligase